MTPLAVTTRHDLTVELPEGVDLRHDGISVESRQIFHAIDALNALLEELRRIAHLPAERGPINPLWKVWHG